MICNIKTRGICIVLLMAMALSTLAAHADLISSNGKFVDYYINKGDEEPAGSVRITEQESDLEDGWYYVYNGGGAYVRSYNVSVLNPTATPEPTRDPYATATATPTLKPGATATPAPITGTVDTEYTGTIVNYTVPQGGLMLYDKPNGKQVESAKNGTKLTLTLDVGADWYSLYFNGKVYYVPESSLYATTLVTPNPLSSAVPSGVASVVIGDTGTPLYSKLDTKVRPVSIDWTSETSNYLEPNKRVNARYYSTSILMCTIGSTTYYFPAWAIDSSKNSSATVAGNDSTNLVTEISFTLPSMESISLYKEKNGKVVSSINNESNQDKTYTLFGIKLDSEWYMVTYQTNNYYIKASDISNLSLRTSQSAVNQNASTNTFRAIIGSKGAGLYATRDAKKTPVRILSAGMSVLAGLFDSTWYTYFDEADATTYYLLRTELADATSTTAIGGFKVTTHIAVSLYDNISKMSIAKDNPSLAAGVYVMQSYNDEWYTVVYDGTTYFVKKIDVQVASGQASSSSGGKSVFAGKKASTILVPDSGVVDVTPINAGTKQSFTGPCTLVVYEIDTAIAESEKLDNMYANGQYYITADCNYIIEKSNIAIKNYTAISNDAIYEIEPIANVSDGKTFYVTIGLKGAQLYVNSTLSDDAKASIWLGPGEVVQAKKYTDSLYIVNGYYLSVKDIASIRGGDDAAAGKPTAAEESVAEVAKGTVDTTFAATIISYTIPQGGLWLFYDEAATKPALNLDAGKKVQLNADGNVYTVWYGGNQYYVPSSVLSLKTSDTVIGGTYSILLTREKELYTTYTANPKTTGEYLTGRTNNVLHQGTRVNVSIVRYVDNKTKDTVLIYRYTDLTGKTLYFYGIDEFGITYNEEETFAALVSSNVDANLMTKITVQGRAQLFTTPDNRVGTYIWVDPSAQSATVVLYGVKYNNTWYRVIYNDRVYYLQASAAIQVDQVVIADGATSTTYTVVIGSGGAKLYTKPTTNMTATNLKPIGTDNYAGETLASGDTVLASKVSGSWFSTTIGGRTLYFMSTSASSANTTASISSYVITLTSPISLYATISNVFPCGLYLDQVGSKYTLRRINKDWSSVYYQGNTYYIKNSDIPSDALEKSTPIATTSVGNTYKITLGKSTTVYSDSRLTTKRGTLSGGTQTTGVLMYVENVDPNNCNSPQNLVYRIPFNGTTGYIDASAVTGVYEGDEIAEAKLAEQEAKETGSSSVTVGQTVMHEMEVGEKIYPKMDLTSTPDEFKFKQTIQLTKVDASWYSLDYYGETWYYPASKVSAEKSGSGGTQVSLSVGESYNYTFTESAILYKEPDYTSDIVGVIPDASNEKYTITRVSEQWYEIDYKGTKGYVQSIYIKLPFIPNTTNTPSTTDKIQHDGTGYITPFLMISPASGSVNLRKSPSTSSTALERIPNGVQVKNNSYVVDANNKVWYNVTYNNKTGYVHGDYVSPVGYVEVSSGGTPENDIGRTLTVNTTDVNVRSGPGMSYSIVGKLAKGDPVIPLSYTVGSDSMYWYSFKLTSTQTAYIRADYLAGSAAMSGVQSGNVAIKAGGTNLRSGPGESFSVVTKLARDIIVTIVGTGTDSQDNTWYYVVYEGIAGYLRQDLVRPLTASEQSALVESVVGSYIELRSGSKGQEVVNLQQQLVKLGYLASGDVDGNYGTKTINAIKAFQKAKGMSQTGIATAAVQAALYNAPQGVSGSAKTLDWFSTGFTLINANKNISVYDINVGISWNATYIEGANHADIIPASKADADKLRAYNITGSYIRRPVIVTIAGQNYAGSLYAVGHGNKSFCSYFHGVMCIHFTGSKTHGSGQVDKDHQSAIQSAITYSNSQSTGQ